MTIATTTDRHGGVAAKILATVAVIAFAGAVVTVSSLALFTDSADVTGNAFATGNVDIAATPATAVVTMPAMVPGDEVTAPLTVENLGTTELRYAATSTSAEDVLASALVLTIRSGVTSCDDTNWDATGTEIYSGILGATTTAPLFGSPTTGAQAGDRVLAAGADESLCVNVALPLGAASSVADLSTDATFAFAAEQTANNP